MAKYRLGKSHIKRLISGSYVNNIDGSKYYASDEVIDTLSEIENNDLYSRVDVFLDSEANRVSVVVKCIDDGSIPIKCESDVVIKEQVGSDSIVQEDVEEVAPKEEKWLNRFLSFLNRYIRGNGKE